MFRFIKIRSLTMSAVDDIVENLKFVNDKILKTYESLESTEKISKFPRLVAVSKTKPVESILAAYSAGQRHFGENYVQELVQKANDERILKDCSDICWHFIGTLQKSKVSKIASQVPNLFVVETVDSKELADSLQKQWTKRKNSETLDIFLQINTSGEEQKSGCEPSEAVSLSNYIKNNCVSLRLKGFMTIGSVEKSVSGEEVNSDFEKLVLLRKEWCKANAETNEKEFELSMGMSADFETAIKMGSTNVRIGSTIFGSRNYPDSKK